MYNETNREEVKGELSQINEHIRENITLKIPIEIINKYIRCLGLEGFEIRIEQQGILIETQMAEIDRCEEMERFTEKEFNSWVTDH